MLGIRRRDPRVIDVVATHENWQGVEENLWAAPVGLQPTHCAIAKGSQHVANQSWRWTKDTLAIQWPSKSNGWYNIRCVYKAKATPVWQCKCTSGRSQWVLIIVVPGVFIALRFWGMCSKPHPVVLIPASTPHTCSGYIPHPSAEVVFMHFAITWCPYPPFKPHSVFSPVACYVVLLLACMLRFASCMLHDTSTFQEPSGALLTPSQGQSVQQRKDALAQAKIEFHRFIHRGNRGIVCIVLGSHYLDVRCWASDIQRWSLWGR